LSNGLLTWFEGTEHRGPVIQDEDIGGTSDQCDDQKEYALTFLEFEPHDAVVWRLGETMYLCSQEMGTCVLTE